MTGGIFYACSILLLVLEKLGVFLKMRLPTTDS